MLTVVPKLYGVLFSLNVCVCVGQFPLEVPQLLNHLFSHLLPTPRIAKYKQIQRPNENRVLLLITKFKEADEGRYQCSLTNPITGQTFTSPEVWNLRSIGEQFSVYFES